jgi:hypothetical protein
LSIESLDDFEITWGDKYPAIIKSWRNNWERVIPFLQFPKEIRKVIYTTNIVGTPGEAWLDKQVKFLSGKGLAIQPELSVAA